MYSVGAPFAQIAASMWCGMEPISLWRSYVRNKDQGPYLQRILRLKSCASHANLGATPKNNGRVSRN